MVFPTTVPTQAVFESHCMLGALPIQVGASTVGAAPGGSLAHSLRWWLVPPWWSVATSAATAAAIVRTTALPLHGGRKHPLGMLAAIY